MKDLILGAAILMVAFFVYQYRFGSTQSYDNQSTTDVSVTGYKNISVIKTVGCNNQDCQIEIHGSLFGSDYMYSGFRLEKGRYEVEYNQDVILSATPLESRRTEFNNSAHQKSDYYANRRK